MPGLFIYEALALLLQLLYLFVTTTVLSEGRGRRRRASREVGVSGSGALASYLERRRLPGRRFLFRIINSLYSAHVIVQFNQGPTESDEVSRGIDNIIKLSPQRLVDCSFYLVYLLAVGYLKSGSGCTLFS